MATKEIDEPTGVETTGHVWDGIKELNNPLPRWWLIIFYVSIVFSIGYWIFYPAWPLVNGYTKGLSHFSDRRNVEAEVAQVAAARNSEMQALLSVQSIADVEKNPQLLQFATTAGASLFGDNCATCHQVGGQGAPGYPTLADDDWLWGGKLADIQQTIRYGVRSGDPKARVNVMQAYGRDGVLTPAQINDVVDYVLSLSGAAHDAKAAARGGALFADNCVACHGTDGKGNHALGAPNLTDQIWLYGGDRKTITATLTNGRGGVMPAWASRLSDPEITALAVYVHALGGGE